MKIFMQHRLRTIGEDLPSLWFDASRISVDSCVESTVFVENTGLRQTCFSGPSGAERNASREFRRRLANHDPWVRNDGSSE